MSRTIRKINERTRQWILAPDINPRTGVGYDTHINYKRRNDALLRGQDGVRPSEVRMSLSRDRHGNTKHNNWEFDWTGSRHISRRYVNRLQRAADKRKIIMGYHDHLDAIEDEGRIFDYRGYDIDSLDYEMEQYYQECILDEYYDELDNTEEYYYEEIYYPDEYWEEYNV